jgi:hypothetical protein
MDNIYVNKQTTNITAVYILSQLSKDYYKLNTISIG